MKKSLVFLCSMLLVCSSFGQATPKTVKLKCTTDGKIFSDTLEADNKEPIHFDVSELTCCDPAKLVIHLTKKNDTRPLTSRSGPPDFPMSETDAKLAYTCENRSGTGLVKYKKLEDTPPRNQNGNQSDDLTWGNTLQDAIQLSDLWKKKDDESVKKAWHLLLKHGVKKEDFQNITYLQPYIDLILVDPKSTDSSKTVFEKANPSTTGNLSGIFSPTLVIDALGKFAAKRFKQELTIAFLQRFRDTLMSENFSEMRTVFPRTFHTMVSADVFNYAQFYQSLHENAQTDLYNLPENMATLVRGKKGEIEPEAYPAILGSLDLVRQLELRMPASNIVEFLAYRDYVDLNTPTIYSNTARMLGIFSKHIHNWGEGTATGWASEDHLGRLVSDDDAFNFWMALVLKKEATGLTEIKIGSTSLYDILNLQLPKKKNHFREIVAHFAEVQVAAQQLVKINQEDSRKVDLFFQYSVSTLKLLEAGVEFGKILENPTDKSGYDRTLHVLRAGQDLATFAHGKRFGDAISVLLEIIKLLYPENKATKTAGQIMSSKLDAAQIKCELAKQAKCKAKKALKLAKKEKNNELIAKAEELLKNANISLDNTKSDLKAIKKGDPKVFIDELAAGQIDEKTIRRVQINHLLSRIDKYGNLLVSCANAENSDQLLAILERTAAPVQSYRKKRGRAKFSAAINMYPGIAGGAEYQLEVNGSFSKTNAKPVTAFTSPLGLSLNWGIGKKSSFSLFASVIDVGAVTAFRLNDQVSVLPELKWKNVLAPGLYGMWGIRKTPLTLGLGTQYGPALRNIGQGNADIFRSNLRVGISLTVDVPLFFLNSSGLKQKKLKF